MNGRKKGAYILLKLLEYNTFLQIQIQKKTKSTFININNISNSNISNSILILNLDFIKALKQFHKRQQEGAIQTTQSYSVDVTEEPQCLSINHKSPPLYSIVTNHIRGRTNRTFVH